MKLVILYTCYCFTFDIAIREKELFEKISKDGKVAPPCLWTER